jgi:hypothetical protein
MGDPSEESQAKDNSTQNHHHRSSCTRGTRQPTKITEIPTGRPLSKVRYTDKVFIPKNRDSPAHQSLQSVDVAPETESQSSKRIDHSPQKLQPIPIETNDAVATEELKSTNQSKEGGFQVDALRWQAKGSHTERMEERTKGTRADRRKERKNKVEKGHTDLALQMIKALSSNSYECMVCTERILRHATVWHCVRCYAVFHIHCIKIWSRKSREAKEESARQFQLGVQQKSGAYFLVFSVIHLTRDIKLVFLKQILKSGIAHNVRNLIGVRPK